MSKDKTKNPLVSIVVITYNSSRFVIDTLESAKAQTYKNIELIISDDCSTDKTVEICRKWLEDNRERFVRAELITVERNTGISANLNRACKTGNGFYIKSIAGDDILDPNIIEVYVSYLVMNPDISLVFSQNYLIDSNNRIIGIREKRVKRRGITFDSQFQENIISAPTILFTKEIYEKVNGFDESLKIEDIDFYLKILLHAGKIHFIKKTLISYRVHDSNISNKSDLILLEHIKTLHKYRTLHPNYRKNYIIFSKRILYGYKVNGKLSFLNTYKILVKDNQFIFLIFFDVFFWIKYYLEQPIKKILKR